MADPEPVHLLDRHHRQTRSWRWGVCGARVKPAYVTTWGWQVTCDLCNPGGRRRTPARPIPAPVAPQLEDA